MLDLSKLPALELPSEDIEFDVLGRAQKARITAADDEAFLDTADLRDNPIFESKIRRYFLKRCTDLSDKDIDYLMRCDGKAVAEILNKIFNLSDKFTAEQKRLREEAKKNSTAESPTAK